MRAIVQDRFGPPEVLRLLDVDMPEIGVDDVLVEVRAAALNPYDWHMLRGDPLVARLMGGVGLTRPKDRVAGVDAAGVVEAVGRTSSSCGPVRRCWASAWARSPTTRGPRRTRWCPSGRHELRAGGRVPMAAVTALQGIRDVGQVRAGIRCWSTEPPAASARRGADRGRAGRRGHRRAAPARSSWCGRSAPRRHRLRGGGLHRPAARYDVILDNVGNRPLRQVRRALTPTGTLVLNGGGAPGRVLGAVGSIARAVAVNVVVRQRLRPFIAKPNQADLLTLTGLIEEGKLVTVLDRTYPLTEIADGLPRRVEQGHAKARSSSPWREAPGSPRSVRAGKCGRRDHRHTGNRRQLPPGRS